MLFYGPPLHGNFYSELLNLLEGAGGAGGGAGVAGGGGAGGASHATVTTLFCAYDALALARVVGAGRARKMLASDAPTFMFC